MSLLTNARKSVESTSPLLPRFTIGTEAEKDGPWEVHTLSIKDAVLDDAGGFQVRFGQDHPSCYQLMKG